MSLSLIVLRAPKIVEKMIELLAFVAVVVIVIVAIRLGRQDNSPSAQTDRRAGGLSDGLAFARQHAEQTGDTEAVQSIDNCTYKELLERRATKRQQTIQQDYAAYQYNIAGINFRRGISDYVGKSSGYLKPQPSNRHDPNAIAIYASDGHHIGYIPATDTYEVHQLHLRFPIPVSIHIEKCYDGDDRRFFVGTVTIQVKSKNK